MKTGTIKVAVRPNHHPLAQNDTHVARCTFAFTFFFNTYCFAVLAFFLGSLIILEFFPSISKRREERRDGGGGGGGGKEQKILKYAEI